VSSRKRDNQIMMNRLRRARRHDQAAIRRTGEGRDGTFAGVAHTDRAHHYPERLRYGLDGAELSDPGRIGGIPQDSRSRYVGRNLFEQFQLFPAQSVFEIHKAGNVAARPRQATDEVGADRIGDEHENDRQGAGDMLQRRHAQGASR
jgi:hypothetical protein